MIETLKKFCHDDATRPNIATPWSAGEHSYATDGHILIRVPRLEDVPERDDVPAPDELFKIPEPPEWFALADMALPAQESTEKTCPDCNGATAIEAKEEGYDCPECDGGGTVEFDNRYSDYEVDCKTCSGGGKIKKCEPCKSAGKITTQNMQPTQVGNAHFQLRYLLLLKGLPGCKLGPSAKDKDVASFTFDGGDGRLMPMIVDAWRKV